MGEGGGSLYHIGIVVIIIIISATTGTTKTG
jgi:hypothetical protein